MMQRHGTLLLCLLALALTAGPVSAAVVFTDVTPSSGTGLPGVLTESVAWGDFDSDGDQDLYLTSNGPNNLFRNDGGGLFTDVTTVAGVGHPGFSVGAAWGDLDNDGDLDLYVVSFQAGPDVLYRNDGPGGPGGEHVFTDVTAAAGMIDESTSRGIALIDYNRDGLLDVYVNAIGPDLLYENQGSLVFSNIAGVLGVATAGQGVGAVATDLDRNGWVDLFTGNRSGDLNRLYVNHAGVFTDITVAAGIDKVGQGMGVHSMDYDNDLDFDLYWTTWPGILISGPLPNAFYENQGDLTFIDVAPSSGTTDPNGWGISNNAADVDNDGWEDFFVTNGFSDATTPAVLFRNEGGGSFTDATAALEGGPPADSRGVAFGDMEGDGDLDLVVTSDASEESIMWRNDSTGGDHWLTLDLRGACSNRSAVGTLVEVTTTLRRTVKEVSGGAGRGSFNSLPVEFGLGAATVAGRIEIHWLSGIVQTLEDVAVDQILTVNEPCDSMTVTMEQDLLFWAQPARSTRGAFEVVRGNLGALASTGGDFSLATEVCLSSGLATTYLQPAADPAEGEGWYYLVRDLAAGGSGSFDSPSPWQSGPRDAGIEASPGACP